MKKFYIHIIVGLIFLSCTKDNIGPIFEKEITFFDEERPYTVAEDDTEDIAITVSTTAVLPAATQVTLGGTAVEGVNYTVVGDLALSFSEGNYSDQIVVRLIDNSEANGDVELILSLPEGQGYSDSLRHFTLLIEDNEKSKDTFTVPIEAFDDDVEEGQSGDMYLDSSDLELGEYDTAGDPDAGIQVIGLRFNGLSVPAGATITQAFVQFTCDNVGADPVELTIYAEATGNSPAFTTDNFNLTSRTKTTASAIWSVPEWVAAGDNGPAQRTVDISSVIQEVIDREDWIPKGSISIIMVYTGVSATVTKSDGGREAEAFDGTAAPQLTLSYEKL